MMGLFAGVAIEGMIAIGIGITAAIGILWYEQSASDQKSDQAAKAIIAKFSNESPELHSPWDQLQPYQGKVRRGTSSKGKTYYYQKDMTHNDVEVYKLFGSTGYHIGSVSLAGGPIIKGPVKGRTIDL